jgi:hypothetical protein
VKPIDAFSRLGRGYRSSCKACSKDYDRAHRVERRDTARRWWRRVKAEVMAHYGGRCACCGETEPVFLTIDHIHNDGAHHRAVLGTANAIASWLRAHGFPPGFQVLCWNCNRAKYALGQCPHQRTVPTS